jgi:hypothetical protein
MDIYLLMSWRDARLVNPYKKPILVKEEDILGIIFLQRKLIFGYKFKSNIYEINFFYKKLFAEKIWRPG